MQTLLLFLAMQVVSVSEMTCLGSISDILAPMELYVAGVEQEGYSTIAAEGSLVYLEGPRVPSLTAGEVYQIVRPQGKIRDRLTNKAQGIYHVDVGRVQIETVQREGATARVLISCCGLLKGDLAIPIPPRPVVEFTGELSDSLTPFPQGGLVSSILLGKNDTQELAAGNFCFIGVGQNDGVKIGDRFTVYRPQSRYNPGDMRVNDTGVNASYSGVYNWQYRSMLNGKLRRRNLPHSVLGDIVIVDVGSSTATGKIINSLYEIHLGDIVVKR